MNKPEKHILVCSSFRPSGEPKGKCHKKGSGDFLAYIENEVIDRGLEEVLISSTCCLKQCDDGPIMVIYPDNIWYGHVENEEAIDAILDAMEDGKIAEDYVLE